MFKYLMGLAVCACLMASPVFAGGGGGGAKKDANIRVIHNLTGANDPNSVIVVADPPASFLNRVTANTAVTRDATAVGGVVLNKGKSVTIPVKSGNVPLFAYVTDSNGRLVQVVNATVPVARGRTVTVRASDVISSSPSP